MLFSTFSSIIGSNKRPIYNIFLFLSYQLSISKRHWVFLLSSVLFQLQDVSEGHQLQLFSVFSTFPSALFQAPYVKLCRLFSRKKKTVPFPCSVYTDLLQRLKEQSRFCCLFLQHGQLSTRNYAKAVDLFHGIPVPRTVWADLGCQGNNIYTTPSLITLGCQFGSWQVYQKQHKMFATVRLTKALSQNAEHHEKFLGLIKQNPLSSSGTLISSWKKKSLSICK